ncbi:MAG: VOC family protein, partial [Gemmatimonadetes bacterium]|nr:VOC family protein [Gemmatimonadota bacterium]
MASSRLAHVALIVADYDEAIRWFTTALGFTVVADEPRGPGKRWVLVAPPGGGTSVLLAKAAGDAQRAAIGQAAGGRVAYFLHTDDFACDHAAFTARGVRFTEGPRDEPYGRVAVFLDLHGNRWDLIEPRLVHPQGLVLEQEFPIQASAAHCFALVSTPAGLDGWWTLTSAGEARAGALWALGFGPEYQWAARVSACEPERVFEFTMTDSDDDWRGSRVRFEFTEADGVTTVRFTHAGWPRSNAHYRVSAHCWAL